MIQTDAVAIVKGELILDVPKAIVKLSASYCPERTGKTGEAI